VVVVVVVVVVGSGRSIKESESSAGSENLAHFTTAAGREDLGAVMVLLGKWNRIYRIVC
jgi:L-asparaginase/Glu-tRNA(Gln) amidotransferase subunit D